jgi:tetratricopeptide (TPR) repeat protein
LRTARVTAMNRANGLTVTIAIMPVMDASTQVYLRDELLGQLRKDLKLSNVALSNNAGRAGLAYDLNDPGMAHQHNHFVLFAHDGTWIRAHASKVSATPADAALFSSWAASLVINARYRPSSAELMGYGSMLFAAKRYPEAIPFMNDALELEKKQPVLVPEAWLVLVDNLGMAYGLTGDNAKARTIFSYGISRRPTYPMFYYNLACALADDGDLEGALHNLRLTVQYRANMLPGEKLPNPLTDSSFKPFRADKRFQEAAAAFAPPKR